MKRKPFVRKDVYRGHWYVQLPGYGFARVIGTDLAGFTSQRQAFRYALRWADTHGGGSVSAVLSTAPKPPGFTSGWRRRWQPVIGTVDLESIRWDLDKED